MNTESMLAKCILTQRERNEKSAELADANQALDLLEVQKKETVTSIQAQIAQQKTKVSILSRAIRDGYEMRLVDCEITYDRDLKMKVIRRLDTGEINEVPMTQVEIARLFN